MRTFANEWEEFNDNAIGPAASPGGRTMLKGAFYAGAYVLFGMLSELPREDEQSAAKRLLALRQEVRDGIAEHAKELVSAIAKAKAEADKKAKS